MIRTNIGKGILCVSIAACLGASALMMGCSGGSKASSASTTAASSTATSSTAAQSTENLMSGKHHAVIQVEGYDPITVELDADAAPITVTNFADLVQDGYYDGKTFYRIVDGFCLQGGTLGNNAAGDDPTLDEITGEFSENGIENPLADNFDLGTIAMARTSDPNSASSTFFITLGNNRSVGSSLDGKYAAFGTIDSEGMQIIEQIVNDHLADVDDPNMGAISDESKQPVIESITFVD